MYELKLLLIFVISAMFVLKSEAARACPRDWETYQDKCYTVKMIRYNFYGAKHTCESYGGVLASLDSAEHAKNMLKNVDASKLVYIGTWVPTQKEGDALVNLDGSPVHWLEIQNKADYRVSGPWGPCLIATRSEGMQFGRDVVEFAVACDTIVDGFVCQNGATGLTTASVSLALMAIIYLSLYFV